MRSKLNFPFIKRKSGIKLQDKIRLSSSPTNSRSAWSYSYDLLLNQICEENLQKEIKSNCLGTEVGHKSLSKLTFDEDLEDDFIFQRSMDSLKGSIAEALFYESMQNIHELGIPKPGNNLELATVNEMEQSLDNLKRLLLSDVQKQQSWLARILLPVPNEVSNSHEIKHRNKDKIGSQILASFIDYIEQLFRKFAFPFFQKFEQVRQEYCREKMKWNKQVYFLKRRISILNCELQNVNKAYRKVAEQLTNLKTSNSQNQSVVGRSSGASLKVPELIQNLQQCNEKLLAKTEILTPNPRPLSYSLKCLKPEKRTNTLNERVSKVDKKELFLDVHKVSHESSVRCSKHFEEYSWTTARSIWL